MRKISNECQETKDKCIAEQERDNKITQIILNFELDETTEKELIKVLLSKVKF